MQFPEHRGTNGTGVVAQLADPQLAGRLTLDRVCFPFDKLTQRSEQGFAFLADAAANQQDFRLEDVDIVGQGLPSACRHKRSCR